MISYCPIEEEETAAAAPSPQPTTTTATADPFSTGNFTECSYLVMFFIAGVIMLALTDMAAARK